MSEISIKPFGDLKSKEGNWGYLVIRNGYEDARMSAKTDGEYFILIKKIDPC